MKYRFSLATALLSIVILAGYGGIVNVDMTATPRPTYTFLSHTAMPTSIDKPDSASFDISTAIIVKAPNNVFEILVPRGWIVGPETIPGYYQLSYNVDPDSVRLEILVGSPQEVYGLIFGPTKSFDSPKIALEYLKETTSNESFIFQDIRPVRIGKFVGLGIAASQFASNQDLVSKSEMWIAPLVDGKIAMIIMGGTNPIWNKAQPILYKIVESLVINVPNIPTLVPGATPYSLRATQTSVWERNNMSTASSSPSVK